MNVDFSATKQIKFHSVSINIRKGAKPIMEFFLNFLGSQEKQVSSNSLIIQKEERSAFWVPKEFLLSFCA